MLRVAVVGDYRADNETHLATDAAFVHASGAVGTPTMVTWLGTDGLASGRSRELERFECFLIAPGSPYRDQQGALAAIEFARTADVPLLGTCGGFQHLIIEVARDVLGYQDAGHAEVEPDARHLFITPLSCPLAGKTMTVDLADGSLAAAAYGRKKTTERYYCQFGLNPSYTEELETAGLVVTGTGPEGEARIVELPGLRFFMGTLFVPQASSSLDAPHPLVMALLRAASRR